MALKPYLNYSLFNGNKLDVSTVSLNVRPNFVQSFLNSFLNCFSHFSTSLIEKLYLTRTQNLKSIVLPSPNFGHQLLSIF